jgi:hypothetical protein
VILTAGQVVANPPLPSGGPSISKPSATGGAPLSRTGAAATSAPSRGQRAPAASRR